MARPYVPAGGFPCVPTGTAHGQWRAAEIEELPAQAGSSTERSGEGQDQPPQRRRNPRAGGTRDGERAENEPTGDGRRTTDGRAGVPRPSAVAPGRSLAVRGRQGIAFGGASLGQPAPAYGTGGAMPPAEARGRPDPTAPAGRGRAARGHGADGGRHAPGRGAHRGRGGQTAETERDDRGETAGNRRPPPATAAGTPTTPRPKRAAGRLRRQTPS
jgi:hypothetical protein